MSNTVSTKNLTSLLFSLRIRAAMSLARNKSLIRRMVNEMFNKHNIGATDRYFSDDYIQHNAAVAPLLQGVTQFFNGYLTAFPDLRCELEHVFAEGDRVVAVGTWRGTHRATFLGMPPSAKQVTFRTADVFRIADGKIAEHWQVMDNRDMLVQIGRLCCKDRAERKINSRQLMFFMTAGKGKIFSIAGGDVTVKLTADDTGGAFSLYETVILPQNGVPAHVHYQEDETFYVLEGEFEFELGDQKTKITASSGSIVRAERNTRHQFTNVGSSPGKMTVVATPGGIEKFFEEFSQLLSQALDSDIEAINALAQRYNTKFVE